MNGIKAPLSFGEARLLSCSNGFKQEPAVWLIKQHLKCSCVQGNVVLTDSKYEVLTLLRSHRDDDKGMALMPRHPYPIHTIRLRTPLDADQLSAALAAAEGKATIKGILELFPRDF